MVLLLCTEGVLHLFGFGYPVTFFLKLSSGEKYVTNERFAWQFHTHPTPLKPVLAHLPAQKAPGTFRVCILGESAAAGTPDPAFGFGRILEVQLRRLFPDRRFEVVNAAMRGINSHAIRLIARECAEHQVDCFLVYMGNNEVIGLHSPDAGTPAWEQWLPLIRAAHKFQATKLGQLVQAQLRRGAEPPKQDMDYFRRHSLRPDDCRRDRNRENFRANLEDIIRSATRSGARVILATVAANLKDFPPVQSLHRADLSTADLARWDAACQEGNQLATQGRFAEALQKFQAAAKIDDHSADLHFRIAECSAALGDQAQAKAHYTLARDWDALQLRTDTRMNEIIKEVAARYESRGVAFADVEKVFAESDLSENGIPGAKLFCDHVHPTFAGNYLLARAFLGRLTSVLGLPLSEAGAKRVPTQQECADALAYTQYDDLNVTAAMVRLTSGPPFLDQLNHAQRQAAAESASRQALAAFDLRDAERCLATYRLALRERPDDWALHYNLGIFCQELGRFSEAAEQLAYVANEFPEIGHFQTLLAAARARAAQRDRGGDQVQGVARSDSANQNLPRR